MSLDVMLCLPLGGKRSPVRWVLIDAADKPLFDQKRWWVVGKTGYVMGQSGRGDKAVFLHRWLAGLKPGDRREMDHKNRRRRDNRRCNLRIVSHAENCGNTSRRSARHRGVTWRPDRRMWEASVRIAGRTHFAGRFADEAEAADAAREYRLAHLPGALD